MSTFILEFTKKLCAIPSVSSDIEQLHEVIDLIQKEFVSLEWAVVQKIVHNQKPSLLVQNFEWKHADIVLNAHIDVVPPSSNDQFDAYEKDGRLYARWAWDMKAWVAIIVLLMKELLQDKEMKLNITLMLTSDEEVGGFDGVGFLVKEGYTWDVVLIPDGGSLQKVVHAQKWIYMAKVQATGKACHSARPWLGENALHNIVNYFQVLRDEVQDTMAVYQSNDHWGTSVNLNMLQWWETMNAVPDFATASIDIRFTEKYSLEQIKKKVVSQMHSFNCRLTKELTGELLYTDPANKNLQQYLQVASTVLGEEVSLEKEHGGSDGRFFPAASTVIIHRPTCSNIHGKEESVVINDLQKIYDIYKQFIYYYQKEA